MKDNNTLHAIVNKLLLLLIVEILKIIILKATDTRSRFCEYYSNHIYLTIGADFHPHMSFLTVFISSIAIRLR
jgi:hypothetical protein